MEDDKALEMGGAGISMLTSENEILCSTRISLGTEVGDVIIRVVVESETPTTGNAESHGETETEVGLVILASQLFCVIIFKMPKRYRSRPFSAAGRRVRMRKNMFTAAMVRSASLRRAARFGARGMALYYGYQGARSIAKRIRFSRKNIGERVGSDNAKRAIVDSQLVTNTLDTRFLYSHEITDLTQGTTEDERLRRVANIRGWKVCLEIMNLGEQAQYWNIAVISPKKSNSVSNNDFFRAYNDEREQAFGTSLSGMELHCLPINTDEYTILRHERHILAARLSGGTSLDLTRANYKQLNWWVPLRRQLRYDSGAATTEHKVYLVYWLSRVSSDAGDAATPADGCIQRKVVCVFREPK